MEEGTKVLEEQVGEQMKDEVNIVLIVLSWQEEEPRFFTEEELLQDD